MVNKRRKSYSEALASPALLPKSSQGAGDAETKTNVRVVVRIRPPNKAEENSRCVVKAMNEHVLVFDPRESQEDSADYQQRRKRVLSRRKNKDLKFAFDYVFSPNAKNCEVYSETTKSILDRFLDGYNCSVFAYGATGAGKTFSMLGNASQPGVIYLTMMDLYCRIEEMQAEKTCDVAVSYLEVYNEQIHDLLMKKGVLPIRENAQNGIVISGLSLHKPKTAEELLNMLYVGNRNRTQHPTDANAESSRSHAVFLVYLRQKDRTANVSAMVNLAKMCLVDLAGSERATVTKNRGARFREGANINRSLLALGNVINSLADSEYKGHVPYRDSKLTRLLKDSLGGNCHTVMIAAVSPSSHSYEDTYNTLRYADRAKNIQSTLKKTVLNVDYHVVKYGKIIQELRDEISDLKRKLQESQEAQILPPRSLASTLSPPQEIEEKKQKIETMYSTRQQLCKEFLDTEIKCANLTLKISRKERSLARIRAVCNDNSNSKLRVENVITASKRRLSSCQQAKTSALLKLQENSQSLEAMETILTSDPSDGKALEAQHIKLFWEHQKASTTCSETKECLEYTTKVIRRQERELLGTERFVLQLLHLVRLQHFILKGHGILTPDLETQFMAAQKKAEGQEVSFSDQNSDEKLDQMTSVWDAFDFRSLPSAADQPSVTKLGVIPHELGPADQPSVTKLGVIPHELQPSVTKLGVIPHELGPFPAADQPSVTKLGVIPHELGPRVKPALNATSTADGISRVCHPLSERVQNIKSVKTTVPFPVSHSVRHTGAVVDSVEDNTFVIDSVTCSSTVMDLVNCNSSATDSFKCRDSLVMDSVRSDGAVINKVLLQSTHDGFQSNHLGLTHMKTNAPSGKDLDSTFTIEDDHRDRALLALTPVIASRSSSYASIDLESGSHKCLEDEVFAAIGSHPNHLPQPDGEGKTDSQEVSHSHTSNTMATKSKLLSLLSTGPDPLTGVPQSSTSVFPSLSTGHVGKEIVTCVQLSTPELACRASSVNDLKLSVPVRKLSYADVAATPPSVRRPLRQVNQDPNTPLTPKGPTNTLPRQLLNKENAENIAKTFSNGTKSSILKGKPLFEMPQRRKILSDQNVASAKPSTPSYMKMTKSAASRNRRTGSNMSGNSGPQREIIIGKMARRVSCYNH